MKIEHKAVGVAGVEVLEKGLVRAIVSVTGIKDNVNDIILPGAYAKSLAVRKPKGVWHHNWHESVSRTEAVKELMPLDPNLPKELPNGEPWPKEAGAVEVLTRFNLKTQRGSDAYEDVIFFGDDQEWSIGYNVPVGDATIDTKSGTRSIRSLDWYEYSPVLFGAMPIARTASGVKEAQQAFAEIKSLHGAEAENFLMEVKSLLGEDAFVPEESDNDPEWSENEETVVEHPAEQIEVLETAVKVLTELLGETKSQPVQASTEAKTLMDYLDLAGLNEPYVQEKAIMFEEANAASDIGGMETAANDVLEVIEETIADGGDVDSLSEAAGYLAGQFSEFQSEEPVDENDPEFVDLSELEPIEDDEDLDEDDEEDDPESGNGSKSETVIVEYKDLFEIPGLDDLDED